MTRYEWTPLTEEDRWRNAGLGPVLDAAALGDPKAQILMKRLLEARDQMQPEVDRHQAEFEREWMEGLGSSSGLSLLVGEGAKK